MIPAAVWDAIYAIEHSKSWHIILAIASSGAFLAVLRGIWGYIQKRADRGRKLVDEARPELVPGGLVGSRQSGYLTLENIGAGAARNIRASFSGSGGLAAGGDIGPGVIGRSRELQYGDSPFFRVKQAEPARFTVLYTDRLGNDYTLTIPLELEPRADGEFNMGFDWSKFTNTGPHLGWRDHYRLGK
jgi:hypothetical protein